MSALAKIKKTAAQHEQDRHYDKALAEYARLLDGGAGSDEEVDVTLYNRAGDLALRAGDVPRAVTYFERAIDLYAAGGFLNNAVALAVKILRHAPGHLAAHHTLGVLYGRKGFRAEARQHLADYAAQMHRAGRADEVGRTLAELAALGATADDITAVRELLTARAGGPDDAGALVRAFDAALGPAHHTRTDLVVEATPGAAASLPLSELIEFEIRGPRFAPAGPDTAVAASVRWTTALPGDPPPLLLSTLRAPALSPDLELLDLGPTGPALIDADADTSAASAVGARPAAPFDEEACDVVAPGTSSAEEPTFEISTFDVPGGEAPSFEVPSFEFPLVDTAADSLGGALWLPDVDAAAPESAVSLPFLDDVIEEPAPAAATPTAPATGALPADAVLRAADEPTDLGEWLRSTESPASTRLVTPAPRESGDESADFDAALRAFTTGIAQSVDAGDRDSHYDLGVAFREMGLLSDAVREFQRALAAPGSGLREREALAQCFLDLGRPELALATLEHAAAAAVVAGTAGDTLLGVHYVLAESARAIGRFGDAREWYVRVLATDYAFRDAATHLAALPPPGSPVAIR